ncbi:MAG: hypothetical protein FJ240_07640 [Nitrospira sp.]|nr:hypothetical protein [Nitrospira sp.]
MRTNSSQDRLLVKHFVCTLILLTAAVCMSVPDARASGLVGMSKVDECVKFTDRICEDNQETTYVTVPVSYGLETEIYATSVKGFKKGEETTSLENTLELVISKEAPILTYPLRYLHTVAYAPYEEVRKIPNKLPGVQACVDGASASNPTCGWITQGDVRIEDSQGFCSNRDPDKLLNRNFDPTAPWRGEEVLGVQSTMRKSFSIAHCMELGTVYFHGYEIGANSQAYKVNLKFSIPQQTGAPKIVNLELTPGAPVSHTSDAESENALAAKAELLGDFQPFAAAPDLSNYILYIASSPETSQMVRDYSHNMLLVPREMVSGEGSECNKVGAAFSAFRKEAGSADKTKAGECLANQLFHMHQEDLQRLVYNQDADAKYLVSSKKPFKNSMTFDSLTPWTLQYKIKDINNSLVSVSLRASQIQLVQSDSVGTVFAKFDNDNPFTSMSKDGYLKVTVTNAGEVRTGYIVEVTGCSDNIIGNIPAKAVTLNANNNAVLYFDINTSRNVDMSSYCWVRLKSATGKLYEEVEVKFNTKEHASKYPWELKIKNKESKVGH